MDNKQPKVVWERRNLVTGLPSTCNSEIRRKLDVAVSCVIGQVIEKLRLDLKRQAEYNGQN